MKRILFSIAPQELFRHNSAQFWSTGPLRIIAMLKNPEQHRLYSSLNITKKEDFEVKLLDGDVEGLESTLQAINPEVDILAIHNPSSYSYANTIKLAKRAKEVGVKSVVVGGHHVNFLHEQVLKNNPEIDLVFTGRGEIGFLKYCLGYPLKEIENIAFRNGQEVQKTHTSDPAEEGFIDFANSISNHPLHIDNLPPVDYSLLNLEKYFSNFADYYSFAYGQKSASLKRAMVEFTHEGCLWRQTSGGCNFCALPTKGMIYRNPEIFWRKLEKDVRALDVQLVKDYGDCLTGSEEYVRALADTKPQSLGDIKFEAYVRASEVVRGDTLEHLKKLGLTGAFVGLESASDRILKDMHKGASRDINRKALEALANNGITLFCSVILGSRGETKETLDETFGFFQEMASEYPLAMVATNPISVFPGSSDWKELTTTHAQTLLKYGITHDKLGSANMDSVRLAYLETFCPTLVNQCGGLGNTYATLTDYSRRMQNLGKVKNRLGWEYKKCLT